MHLIDIGANLAHDSFRDDLEAILARAADASVQEIVITGSDTHSNQRALALANAYPGRLYCTAGCHPHHADQADGALFAQLRELAAEPAVVALGEMGLDFFRDLCPRDVQQRAFESQLELAGTAGLPVFLHQRDAHARFLPMLREYRDALPAAVAHCFTGSRRELFDLLDMDCHIGITGWICDERRGAHLLDLVPHIPANRLMLETDAPYLLPRNIRPRPKSRRNEPAYLPRVLETVATARGEAVGAVAAATTETAHAFFRLRQDPQQN